jgi:ElaB/YqjD/DUF883 family membrane-anchored ribosome-binding protein
MKNSQHNIDKLISKILSEEINAKSKEIIKEMSGEWTEIEMDEELSGNQSKIDVAKPKGKITAADFKKLRDSKSTKEETGEERDEFDGKPGEVIGVYSNIKKQREMEEAETEEGNAFSGALAKAKEEGDDSFEVDGKTYSVKESKEDMKWIQKTEMKKGSLHKTLGIPEGQKIPKSKLNSIKKDLMIKAKGDKKLSASDSKLLKQVNLALTLGGLNESKNSITLSENELIDMIEKIITEQKVKDDAEADNISFKVPQGLKKTEKALNQSKKVNDDAAQEVTKKMKEYMKDMFMGGNGYEENPEDFPQSNYDMEKEHNEKKYHPSDAVEEYIEAFAYPGMTNLVYDEIKPDDEMIDKQIKGDSKNGNAVTGKDGKALGNVSKRSAEVGERFKKNFDENLYGAEQQKASYKRQPQETIEVAGEGKTKGSLKTKQQGADKASSINKASKILNTLESTEDKKLKVISEEMNKMKNLIEYNRKTQ